MMVFEKNKLSKISSEFLFDRIPNVVYLNGNIWKLNLYEENDLSYNNNGRPFKIRTPFEIRTPSTIRNPNMFGIRALTVQ